MGSIGRYIFRTTLGAFVAVMISLTVLIWVTQALREIELMTNQGQTALVFLQITALIIPHLVVLLAPVALLMASAYVLNKLGTDSEIIVMNASGMSPWRLFRPFLAVAALVSVLVALLSFYIAPQSLHAFRSWFMEVRTDLVTYVVRPGRFINVQKGVTFHIRERQSNGELLGVLIDDKRNPKEHLSILAERGEILKNEHGTFLVLEGGTVQRHQSTETEPNIVEFDRYAFDLSQFASSAPLNQSVRERYLWQLLWPDPNDPLVTSQPGQLRAELHDRLSAPLYPLVFVLVAYAYLGAPRTTRQSRNLSLLGTIGVLALLRFSGFATTVISVNAPLMIAFHYFLLATATALSIWAIGRGVIIEPPALITNSLSALQERFAPRPATA
ncbi:MAG: lipopolysaccharide export system permease protein [Alphaproteobacteria bacterium]|nr:lipopolysaccharide export system permease protein [Alphaproteobacteria bacterium]